MPESGREFSGLREQEARGLKQSGLEAGGGGELAESRGAAGGWGTEAMAPPCLVEKLTVQLPPPPAVPPGLAASAGPAGAFEPQPLPAALHVGVVKTRLLHAEFCPHRASLGLRPAAQCFAKESRNPSSRLSGFWAGHPLLEGPTSWFWWGRVILWGRRGQRKS